MPTTFLNEGDISSRHIIANAGIERSKLELALQSKVIIPPDAWRVWDAVATVLPGTPAADDLGLVTGTFGTNPSYVGTGDVKAAGTVTRYARAIVGLPPDYEATRPVAIAAWTGMITTVAGTSAVIDFEAWRVDQEDGTLGASDLVTDAAQSINSLTEDDKVFNLSASTLNPGDLLDIRMTITTVDGATGTAVIGAVYNVYLLCDRR